MKPKNDDEDGLIFIPYDDGNLAHVKAGPDYGQPWSSSNAWAEIDSKEYPDFVEDISNKILHNPISV